MHRHESTRDAQAPQRANRNAVRALIWLMGTVAAVILAIDCYQGTVTAFGTPSALWLAFFTFAMSDYLLGHGLADVVIRPHRLARVLYFVLFPLIASACLYVAYQLWGTVWLAVVGGFVVGGMLHTAVSWLFLPTIARDERRSHRNSSHRDRWGEPRPYDAVPERERPLEPATAG